MKKYLKAMKDVYDDAEVELRDDGDFGGREMSTQNAAHQICHQMPGI